MPTRDGTMRRDILSAYAASGSRVLSWVIVSALVYRRSPEAFAMLALVRGTLGILNYAALGLLPAMIRALASVPRAQPLPVVSFLPSDDPIPLEYVTPQTTLDPPARLAPQPDASVQRIYACGTLLATLAAIPCVFLCTVLAVYAAHVYAVPEGLEQDSVAVLILGIGFGIIIRWYSEPSAAILQTRDHIALDNCLQIGAETLWVVIIALPFGSSHFASSAQCLEAVARAYFISSTLLLGGRAATANYSAHVAITLTCDWTLARPLLATGILITLAQLADYLYSSTDYLLINHLLTPLDLTHYAPAVQIDSGLLLLVTALGSVLLPKTALAHAAGNRAAVRAYYVRGSLASAGLLIAASLAIYLAAPLIFKLWFGDPMPGTVAILPLVLLNTVIGGSSAVGRAILIGIGKAKPFTISVLIAGVTNVVCSYCFVHYFHWGLSGIILGTIVAVVARCGIWMPWYVLRELRTSAGTAVADESAA